MKNLLLACGLIGAIATANAQPAQPAPADHPMSMGYGMSEGRMMNDPEDATHLQKTLQLSDEQTAKVKKIFESRDQQRKTLEEKYKPQLDAFHADMKKLHEQTHDQLKGVLTPKQQQALEAQCDQHEHMRGKMHRDYDGDDHHEEMHGK